MNRFSGTVVLADDERLITTVLGLRLQQTGLTVRHARDGEHALQLVESIHPDLVILDVDMPQRDGLSVCNLIRSRADLAGIPVVILTGKSDAATHNRIMALGVTYVAKSTEMWPRLQEAMSRILASNVT